MDERFYLRETIAVVKVAKNVTAMNEFFQHLFLKKVHKELTYEQRQQWNDWFMSLHYGEALLMSFDNYLKEASSKHPEWSARDFVEFYSRTHIVDPYLEIALINKARFFYISRKE